MGSVDGDGDLPLWCALISTFRKHRLADIALREGTPTSRTERDQVDSKRSRIVATKPQTISLYPSFPVAGLRAVRRNT
jgi:hypothetical protein